MTSISLFLEDVKSIDFCTSNFKGCTWLFSVEVSGQIQDLTGMVIDFSDVKKALEEVLKKYDHKFWVPSFDQGLWCDEEKKVAVQAPPSFFVKARTIEEFCLFVEQELYKKLSLENIKVTAKEIYRHHYLHVLPRHLGICQQFHGHATFFQPQPETQKAEILEYLNGRFFICRDYGTTPFVFQNQEVVGIHYEGTLGKVDLVLPKEKVVFLEREATCEVIALHLSQVFQLTSLTLFEGLKKGAKVTCHDHLSCQ